MAGLCNQDLSGSNAGHVMDAVNIRKTARTALVLIGALMGGIVHADPLPTPEGEVLLTVSGAIETTNGDGIARFDRAMLEAAPRESFETGTIWTEGVETFEGVSLRTLLDMVGAEGSSVRAYAANDYAIEIPVETIEADVPIVADRRDGATMSLRDKGPLWVIYPFDSDDRYQSEVVYSRSIWQLNRLEILE